GFDGGGDRAAGTHRQGGGGIPRHDERIESRSRDQLRTKPRRPTMAPQAELETPTKSDPAVEQKLQKLRELYADASEVGKAALQNGVSDIGREVAALKGATGGQSGRRGGARRGIVSELTAMLAIAKGGAKRRRGLLELVGGTFRGFVVGGPLLDMPFFFL